MTASTGLPDAPRPQPIGALPWPAGMLLLPQSGVDVAAALVRGAEVADWPSGTEFMRLALDGDAEGAAALLSDDDLVSRYNRAILIGGDGVWAPIADEASGDLAVLTSVARFSVGDVDDPPEIGESRGEVAAMAGSARASAAMERNDFATASAELAAAADAASEGGSPVLAASLRLARAELLRERLDDPRSASLEADRGLQGLPLEAARDLRAELQVSRGLARQQLAGNDRGALLAVVADLTEASKILREDTHPEMFATINQHLALAYLIMPMSDQGDRIRVGVAVNALRSALRVFTPQTHPVAWASTQLNLANALQYLPSVHQEQNLDEAVQLYEELLQYRDAETDPLGYARILANQGNALGHLGVFSDARARLTRAREIFAEFSDEESAAGVDEVLESLTRAEQEASS